MLWSLAIACAVLYYNVRAVGSGLDSVGEVKKKWGYGFAALSLAISGGLVPSVALALLRPRKDETDQQQQQQQEQRPSELFLIASNTVMFSLYGMWIDCFYQLQAMMFGEGTDLRTVVTKVAVDQLIFTPFLHVPMIQLSLLYIRCSLHCGVFAREIAARRMLSPHGLLADWWFPALLPTWLVWCPTVCVVYSLPPSLQLVIFVIVMVFWAMIQIVVGDSGADDEATAAMAAAAAGAVSEKGAAADKESGNKGAETSEASGLELTPEVRAIAAADDPDGFVGGGKTNSGSTNATIMATAV